MRTKNPIGDGSQGGGGVGDADNGVGVHAILVVWLDGPKGLHGATLKDEDEEVGKTEDEDGDVHDVDENDMISLDGDAQKKQTLMKSSYKT